MTIVKFSNASVVLLIIKMNDFHSELQWVTKSIYDDTFKRKLKTPSLKKSILYHLTVDYKIVSFAYSRL